MKLLRDRMNRHELGAFRAHKRKFTHGLKAWEKITPRKGHHIFDYKGKQYALYAQRTKDKHIYSISLWNPKHAYLAFVVIDIKG